MICLCNNWSVFRLGSRIELDAKTDWVLKLISMCVSVVFCCFGSRILKLHGSKQMGSNKYGNIDLCP